MEYIQGYCRSNDDRLTLFKWPTEFVAVPQRRQRVESICGQRVAYVSNVTYKIISRDGKKVPGIEVELTVFC